MSHSQKEFATSQSTESPSGLPEEVGIAVEAALDKQAIHVVVLDLRGFCSFTDRFIVCSGNSRPQTQAIADHVIQQLRIAGAHSSHTEGYDDGGWILMDYSDFVVHIFTPEKREFYDLERLWRQGKRLEIQAGPAS